MILHYPGLDRTLIRCGTGADVFGRRRSERQAARERDAMNAVGVYLVGWIAGDDDRVDDAIVSADPHLIQETT
jgi:hypothetical protein